MLNPVELNKTFGSYNIVAISIGKEMFKDVLIDSASFLSKKFGRVCYLSLSKPYGTLVKLLKDNNVDASNFFFIDTLTATVSTPKEAANCVFIEHPSDLTSISLAVTEALKFGCNVVFIDSLSTLLVYNDSESLIKFSDSVMTKIRLSEKNAFIITLKEDETNELIKNLYEFCDKVISV